MSKEAIDAVLAAENKAREDKARAQETARRAVTAASENAKQNLEAAREAAAGDMSEKLRLISEQSDALLKKSRIEAEAEAAAETNAASPHMDEAVDLIIGELLKNVGQ